MEEHFLNNKPDLQTLDNVIKTSTTTVAIRVKDGVIVGTEF